MTWLESAKEKARIIFDKTHQALTSDLALKIGKASVSFALNTTRHLLALQAAVLEGTVKLFSDQHAQKMAASLGRLAVRDVAPLVALNWVNHSVQHYFNEDTDESVDASFMYSLFLSTLWIADYAVMAYTLKYGAQTVVRVLVLDSAALSVFTSVNSKIKQQSTLCDGAFGDEVCNMQRRLKGQGAELLVLLGNERLIANFLLIPAVGPYLYTGLNVINDGRYITRSITPNRCERHKYMEQEFVLALGLMSALSTYLMKLSFERTVGPLPMIYAYAMRHVLLNMHVIWAAHMVVPLVKPSEATVPDLFHYYERSLRFCLDVIWAGLKKRVPLEFQPYSSDQAPFAPLSPAFRLVTKVLNYDLEREKKSSGLVSPWLSKAKTLILPPIFRSAYEFPFDPIIGAHLNELREGTLITLQQLELYNRSTMVAVAKTVPDSASVFLEYKFGIPATLTSIILKLSKEGDFWNLIAAIKFWCGRHNTSMARSLITPKEPVRLLGDVPPVLVPPAAANNPPSVRDIVVSPPIHKPTAQKLDALSGTTESGASKPTMELARNFLLRRGEPCAVRISQVPGTLYGVPKARPLTHDTEDNTQKIAL